jgi:23S rRNA (guanosine2251-2'-O)-methyltransferase
VIVYGRNAVGEAIRGPRAVVRVWCTPGAMREPWLAGQGALLRAASAHEIRGLCGTDEHQGICADVAPFRYADAQELLARPDPLIVALDQVQDPQNLGAICRTAECAGADGLVITQRRAAEVTAAVCKASAGAVEHLPVARVPNLAEFMAEAKRAGLWCYGADAAGAIAYPDLDYLGGVVLVLGSEGRGLRRRVAAACDALISIPLAGRIESLSVSACAAVLLYEARRARGERTRS